MFKRFELEKSLYVHPTFINLWYTNPYKFAWHHLQLQLVNHVLKDVGFVVIITQVTNVKTGRFDPTDGGIYAIVRFVCYAFCPDGSSSMASKGILYVRKLPMFKTVNSERVANEVSRSQRRGSPGFSPRSTAVLQLWIPNLGGAASRSILKGMVERIESNEVVVNTLGLPGITIPRSRLRPGTVFNADKRYFVWTKTQEGGNARYFETKYGDQVRYQVEKVVYNKNKQISSYDSKAENQAMQVTGDLRTFSLGPVHWYTTGTSSEKLPEKFSLEQMKSSAESLNKNEPDYLSFLESLLLSENDYVNFD